MPLQISICIDFGINRKCVCHFLLVRHNILDRILHRFEDIASVLLMTPPQFHPNFRDIPVGPDRPCWGQREHELSLFGREIIFEVFQPM